MRVPFCGAFIDHLLNKLLQTIYITKLRKQKDRHFPGHFNYLIQPSQVHLQEEKRRRNAVGGEMQEVS